jgi:CHAD domain-containing protein
VRELDVALQMLDDLRTARKAPAPAIAGLKRVIVDERARLHAEMVRRLERCDIPRLRKRALAAAARQPRGRVRDERQVAAARDRAARRAVRLQTAIESAAGLYLPDRLHEVRVAVKKLRYALELSSAVSGSRARARIETLRRAQDLLGRMNDLEVLIARTRGVQSSGSAPDLKLSAEMDRLVRQLETECRRLHSQYIQSRNPLLSICDRTIAQAAAGSARAA